jgi:hypothetical protein
MRIIGQQVFDNALLGTNYLVQPGAFLSHGVVVGIRSLKLELSSLKLVHYVLVTGF